MCHHSVCRAQADQPEALDAADTRPSELHFMQAINLMQLLALLEAVCAGGSPNP